MIACYIFSALFRSESPKVVNQVQVHVTTHHPINHQPITTIIISSPHTLSHALFFFARPFLSICSLSFRPSVSLFSLEPMYSESSILQENSVCVRACGWVHRKVARLLDPHDGIVPNAPFPSPFFSELFALFLFLLFLFHFQRFISRFVFYFFVFDSSGSSPRRRVRGGGKGGGGEGETSIDIHPLSAQAQPTRASIAF